jgi:hypothetical protein
VTRDSRQEKARRLRDDFRVTISYGDEGIEARVVGDHGVYYLRPISDGFWRCPCPARTPECAHVLAVLGVTR